MATSQPVSYCTSRGGTDGFYSPWQLNVDYMLIIKSLCLQPPQSLLVFLKILGVGGEGLKQNKRMLCCSVTDNILSLKLPLKLL